MGLTTRAGKTAAVLAVALAVAWTAEETRAASLETALKAPVTFTAPPTAERKGDAVAITFAVSAPIDVCVTVVDGKGAIVRRLAAGVLGKNAPAPFQPDSLKQTITWDGRDDGGQAVLADPARGLFRVQVTAGLRAEHAGTAFGAEAGPNTLTNVIGLAAGPDGRTYVLSERWNRAWWRGTAVHVFRRDGSYERTVKPFPASLPPERVGSLTALRDDRGRPVPVIYRVLAMTYYPHEDMPQQMAVTPDGNLHFLVIKAGYFKDREAEKWLASLAPDGGLAYSTYAGPDLKGENGPGEPYLASSSDGKAVFATGVEGAAGQARNVPVVYRIDLPARQEATVFFGDPKKPAAGAEDREHLADPLGLATDGRGRLFVADFGADRVLVIDEKTGRCVESFAVKAPTWLGVHRRSGAAYVASDGAVVKFEAKGGAWTEAARLALPTAPGREGTATRWSFALDPEAESPILWIGRSRGEGALLRVEEKDGKFSEAKPAGYVPARTYWNVATAYDGRTAACKVDGRGLRLLDEETGQMKDLRLQDSGGQTYRFGPNNQIYGMDHAVGLMRWDQDGKVLPFAASGARLPNRPSGTTSWERDFDVDRAGSIYLKQRGKQYHGRMSVEKYDRDGRLLGTLLWVVSDGAHGPRVDAAGNLYIAEALKPVGERVPEFFKGRLPDAPVDSKGNVEGQYWWMYGSVVKFGPAGGAVWFPRTADIDVYPFEGEAKLPADQAKVKIEVPLGGGGSRTRIAEAELQGAHWFRYGASYVLDMHPGHNRRCHCTATEMDVDDYGRVFYTDQGRFRVVVLDTGGNEILAFGGYGNQDSAAPDLGFNWFTGLGASDRFVYVADGGNRRVVRVALKYAAAAACEVK